MHRFTNILYVHEPAATSGAALARAVRLANSNNARLTLVSVTDELPRTFPNIQKTFRELQEKQLKALLDNQESVAAGIKLRLLTGTPFLEVIREVLRGGHDLVIKAARGKGGATDALFGSTDLHLLRKCPCPVWMIKPSRRKHYARILAAVDTYDTGADGRKLNKLIMDLSTSLATLEGSELHVVHAWNVTHEAFLRSGRARIPKSQVKHEISETRKTHRKLLNAFLAGYDLSQLTAKVHLLKGKPGEVIPSVALKKRVDLVVMGTVARTGVAGLFIGNSAEKTLAQVDCSVLALKPESFVTPVEA